MFSSFSSGSSHGRHAATIPRRRCPSRRRTSTPCPSRRCASLVSSATPLHLPEATDVLPADARCSRFSPPMSSPLPADAGPPPVWVVAVAAEPVAAHHRRADPPLCLSESPPPPQILAPTPVRVAAATATADPCTSACPHLCLSAQLPHRHLPEGTAGPHLRHAMVDWPACEGDERERNERETV
ncbi:hypothetical protein BS78_09G071100 [Paspalum vaginatum]|nr:hypothetical protein BS78_09G071100 [Paspalum vaginatum]